MLVWHGGKLYSHRENDKVSPNMVLVARAEERW